MPKRAPAAAVAWVPPDVAEAKGLEPTPGGAFHLTEQEKGEDGIAQSEVTAQRVQWVDEAPADADDGSGHFELYDGESGEYEPARPVRPIETPWPAPPEAS